MPPQVAAADPTVEDLIRQEATKQGVPPELALAVGEHESGFNPTVTGPKLPSGESAVGTFQLLPSTAERLGVDPHDPHQNIAGGVQYLRELLDRHQGDVSNVLKEYGGVKADTKYVPGVLARVGKFSQVGNGVGQPPPGDPSWTRADGTRKGQGFLGVLPRTDGSGKVSSEISIGVNIDGKEVEVPTMVPTLSPQERDWLLSHDISDPSKIPMAIQQKALDYAKGRIAAGKSPFAGEGEQVGQPPPMTPVASHTQAGQPPPRGTLATMTDSFNPLKREGRRNLAGAAGAAGGALLGSPLGPVGAGTAGVLGAMTAGGLESGAEGLIRHVTGAQELGGEPGTPPPSLRDVAMQTGAGATEQGLYEMGGHALLWPVQAIGRRLLAGRVGRYAAEALSSKKQALLDQLHGALDSAQTLLRGAKTSASEANVATRASTRQAVSTVAGQAKSGVQTAKDVAQAGTDLATAPYADLAGSPPPAAAIGRATNEVIQSGGARRAKDLAGEAVGKAAESGPMIPVAPLDAKLAELSKQITPLPSHTGGSQMVGGRQMTAAQIASKPGIAEALSGVALPPDHPLPKVLADIQGALNDYGGDQIPFSEAHKIKRALDDAVNWNSPAKKQAQQITKGFRGTLRDLMSGHAPYDAATAHYAQIEPLYSQGIAPKLRKLATEEPEAIVRLINPKQPTKVAMLQDLLTHQAAEGGDAAGGQRAWDGVRAAWTHAKIVQGGIDGMADRIAALPPDFAKAFYGDDTGQQVLTHLKAISSAYDAAVAHGEAGVAQATEAGQTAVAGARTLREQVIGRQRQFGQQQVESAAQGVTQAKSNLRTGVQPVKQQERELANSSLAPAMAKGAPTRMAADVLRAMALGPRSIWGDLSIARLLHGPTANDLVTWAAASPTGTRALVKAITSPAPGLALADLARSSGILGGATDQALQPAPSHTVGTPPPAPSASSGLPAR